MGESETGKTGALPVVMLYGCKDEQFKLTRLEGWENFSGRRIMEDGRVLPLAPTVRDESLICEYVVEDGEGKTAFVMLADTSTPVSGMARGHFASILGGHAASLKEAAAACFLVADRLAEMEDTAGAASPKHRGSKTERDFERARRSVIEARNALRRAAASLGAMDVYEEAVKKEHADESDAAPGLYASLRATGESLQENVRDISAFSAGDFTIDAYARLVASISESAAATRSSIEQLSARVKEELPSPAAAQVVAELRGVVDILSAGNLP